MKHRRLGVAAALVALGVLTLLAPHALRHMEFFRVRKIELLGVRHHSPEHLLRALDIEPDRNLFDSLEDIEERALALPGIVFVKAERRLPGTLTIEVEERAPIAFVPTSTGLLAIDVGAHPLTYDPTATGLDLPIIRTADSVLARVLGAVRYADSTLYGHVDAARIGDGEVVVLEMGHTKVILGKEPTADEIRAVGLVRRHLAATERPYEELDARFEGRVIVRGSGV